MNPSIIRVISLNANYNFNKVKLIVFVYMMLYTLIVPLGYKVVS